MPIYEYQCGACQATLERLQKLSDPPLVDCPECGKPELRKLVSAAGFRLKGGGWYETDFKSGQKKNLVESSDVKSGAKTESKCESKGESEPAQTKAGDAKSGDTKTSSKSSDSKSSPTTASKKSPGAAA